MGRDAIEREERERALAEAVAGPRWVLTPEEAVRRVKAEYAERLAVVRDEQERAAAAQRERARQAEARWLQLVQKAIGRDPVAMRHWAAAEQRARRRYALGREAERKRRAAENEMGY